MEKMTASEWKRFLTEEPRTGKLATVRQDGRPHVVPVWFDLDGDALIFTTWYETVKAANIQRDPRVALCVDDERPPFSFVMVEGTAELNDNLEDLKYWATRIAGRYMGPDQAESFGRRNAVPGEMVVRIRPANVVAQRAIAD